MPQRLVDILVCPQCKQKLEYDEKVNRLVCTNHQVAFKINDGIPVLLMDETEKI
ncbi:Trm112 family protein [candidate division GN15 bacterium]|nr:Trm112 family protein [candidate division GN15 bacterium]